VAVYAADDHSRRILEKAVAHNEAIIDRGSWWIPPQSGNPRPWKRSEDHNPQGAQQ
jgi:hypothetical protein